MTKPYDPSALVVDDRARRLIPVPTGGFAQSDEVEEVAADAASQGQGLWVVPALPIAEFVGIPMPNGRGLVQDLERLGADLSPGSILEFANRNGWLTSPLAVWPRRAIASSGGATHGLPRVFRGGLRSLGEPFDRWINEVLRFVALRRLWRALLLHERPSASPAPSWARDLLTRSVSRGRGRVTYVLAAQHGPYEYSEPRLINDAEVLRRLPTADTVAAASYAVCHEVNRSLEGQLDLVVLPFSDRQVRQVPRTVLAAAYLEFALELSGRAPRRPCGYSRCSELIEGRKNKLYCQPSHRAAAARERHEPMVTAKGEK